MKVQALIALKADFPLPVLLVHLGPLAIFGRKLQVVKHPAMPQELRYFGGLSIRETAHFLSISPATVSREWEMAKAWLYSQLTDETRQ